MLVYTDILGVTHDKVADAVQIARAFEPPEGYYLAYSGGKDSIAVKRILDIAGVKYDTHYSVTTVDPRELVRFIISQFGTVIYEMPDGEQKWFRPMPGRHSGPLLQRIVPEQARGEKIYFSIPKIPMRKLIVKKGFPPTQRMRYCCQILKETNGEGRIVVTGVRKAESTKRKANQGAAVVWDSAGLADKTGLDHGTSKNGGTILNYDTDDARRFVEQCYRTHKTLVNPIIEFDEDDVWELIRRDNLPYCTLYDEGKKRLGCIGCPMGRHSGMTANFERWPHMTNVYKDAFQELIDGWKAENREIVNKFPDAETMFSWWCGMSLPRTNVVDGQIKIDELEDLIYDDE